jgi:hypothetical protein
LARLLAQRLHAAHISLDTIAERYYEEHGFESAVFQQMVEQHGLLATYRQWWPSLAYAVERLLVDHPHGIIDLGAGHSHYEDDALFERIQRALVPYDNVILILPSPDLDQSIRILRQRSLQQRGWDWIADGYDFIEHWVKDHCNHDLATLVVYTQGKTPEELCNDIIQRVKYTEP